MTTSITSPAAAAAARPAVAVPNATAAAGQNLAGDVRTFLTMLTTQLRNQDPTQPLDPNSFTAQLSQFAAVEQQIAVNQHLSSLIALQRSAVMLDAAPMVGRSIDAVSDTLVLRGGATQGLRLPAADAQTRFARIAVTDSAGQAVREAIVALDTATQSWTWDGRDGRGRAQAAGNYRVSVTGLDGNGVARGPLDPVVTGMVSAVEREGETVVFALGPLRVPVDALRRVEP
jgi:flagellar basal-body rod modification protein FlgD